MKKSSLKNLKVLFAIIITLLSFNAYSSHVAGGYIQLECTGTPGQYTLRLVLYRDCSGIGAPSSPSISLTNNCGGVSNFTAYLNQVSSQEVSQVCAAQINNTECNGGSLPGYEEYIYEATINLADCDTWTASYSLCCRNNVVNVSGASGTTFVVQSQFNTQTSNCNESPIVTAQPEPFVCNNQPVSYNLGAYEGNGDSISYALVPSVSNTGGTSVNYNGGYSGANPIPGVNIDPVSGTVTYTPTQTGAYIFVIQMTEYDSNGNVISVTNYEYQTYVVNCSNQPPQPPSATPGGGITNVTGSIVQNGPNSLTLCQGNQGCFDVVFTDPDPADVLSVQSNLAAVLPGANISQSGTNPLTVTVCWSPTSTQGTVSLNFLVEDNACPLIGQNNYAATINVTNPGVANVNTTTETCGGTNQGTASISVAGNPGPFTFDIDNQSGPTTASNATGNFSNLEPGTYDYTVTTPGGCQLNGTFTIVPGPPMPVAASGTDATCNGANDGTATANPGGGVAPFIYVWEQGGSPIGQNTQTASNLAPGTYDVTVTDNVGCQATETVVIAEPNPLAGTLTPTATLCNGSCDGELDVTGVGGGTPGYQYSLNGGAPQGGTNFTGLCQGPQQVEITDNNGCSLMLNATVNEPTPVSVSVDNIVDATCGSPNGEITVIGAGGTPPYQYSTSGIPNQASPTLSPLSPGNYTVTITDANGCSSTVNATVGTVAAPTAFVDNLVDLSCFGGNNGSVNIGTTGAVAPITYSLNAGPGQASNQFNNLTAGNYTVDITDGNGCTASTNFTITAPPVLQYNVVLTPASCNGVCDGEIVVNASGGSGTYEYSSNGGLSFGTNNTLTGLCAGNINLIVQDDNGCTSNSTEVITEPTALGASFNLTDPVCEGSCDGEIQVNANGGTAPYQYGVNGGPLQGSSTLTGLCAGNQDVVVEDNNGCQFTSTEVLTDPPGITINLDNMTPSNCGFNDGGLEVSANGVNPPFQYSLNAGPNQGTGVFNSLVAGGYDITVTDALGCTESEFFGVNDIQMDGQLVSQTDVSCFGGSDGDVEVINLAGAAPISFELDNSGVTQTNGTFNGLSAGSHIVTIYDAGFCVYTVPFTINEPDEIQFSTNVTDIACNGGATGGIEFTNVSGGVGGYQYSIDGFTFQASPTFNGLTAGTYFLFVTDGNNCMVQGTATVNQAPPLAFNSNIIDLVCNGDNSGVVQIAASGGTGTYSYSLDNGANFQASETFVNLAAGTYDVVLEDAAGCQITGQVTVNEPAPLAANYTTTDALCNGACDGEVDIVANGGTTPYQYSIDNGTTFTVNSTITGVCAGNYTVLVEDDHGCTITSAEVVGEPTPVTLNSVETPSTCGNPNGEITINANGGTPGYTYSADGGTIMVAGNNFTGLAAGNYDLVVEDQNGCQATGTQTVTNEASPVINFVDVTEPTCNGLSDGSAEVTASGGTGTLNYSVNGNPAQASNILIGLPAGNHVVEVIDANGCTDTENITITEPTPLAFNSTPTDLTCYQNSTGSINITPNGGTPPYQYSFDNGATFGASPNSNFIAAGTYDLVVEDFNGCQASGTETVNEPPLLEFLDIDSVDVTCNSYTDGSIALTIGGGTAPYTYDWSQGVAGNVSSANGLGAGFYDFTVTDDNGCFIFEDVEIEEPDSVDITSIIETNVVCHNNCDGSIEINSPTGAQYSVDGGATFQAANIFNNLCEGTYPIQVQDNVGCIVNASAEIWQPDPLTASTRPDTTVCYGVIDTITAFGTGGIQPYTFQWSNGPTTYENGLVDTVTTTYSAVITDNNGCTATTNSTTITVIPRVEITVSNDTTICPGGTATLTATGSLGLPPYTYSWSDGQTGQTINVSPGVATTYTATVTDDCPHDTTADIDVNIHTLPQVDLVGDQLEGCAPLDVQFTNNTPAGQIGANCTWLIEGVNYPGCNGPSHTFEDPGCYDVNLQVTSPDGCVNDTTLQDYICVYGNPDANFYFDPAKPTVTDNIINFYNTSTGAVDYSWNFGPFGSSTDENPTENFLGVEADDEIMVCLEAVSPHGCIDEICKPVIIYDDFVIYVPNAFTPDDDEFNQTFLPIMPPTVDILEYELLIFDRWGEVLFESHNPNVGWDGTFVGKLCQDGVYVWQIKVTEGEEDTKRTYRGHVTLLK